MFKCTVILFVLIAYAVSYQIIPIIKHDQDLKYDGSYYYDFETENGITHKADGSADEVKGTYKYTAPDGTPIEVIYKAGVDGFEAYGSHIPAVPDHVLRLLEYQRTHPRVYDPYNHGL